MKTLLQSISNGLQDCVHKELEALSSKPTTTSRSASATTPSLPTTVATKAANKLSYDAMDTSSPLDATVTVIAETGTLEQGVQSINLSSSVPVTTPVKNPQQREMIQTPCSPIKVTSPARQIGDMVIHLPISHDEKLLNEYTEADTIYSGSSPQLFPHGASFLKGPLSRY